MEWKPDKRQISWSITVVITAVFIMLFYYLLFKGSNITNGINTVIHSLSGVVYGIIIAYIMTPALNFYEKRLILPIYRKRGVTKEQEKSKKVRNSVRKWSVLLSIVTFCLVLYLLIWIIVPQLVSSIAEIITNIPVYINNINDAANKYFADNPAIYGTIDNVLDTMEDKFNDFLTNTVLPNMSTIISELSKRVINIGRGVFNFFVGIIVAVYVLNSKERFCSQAKKMAYAFFREKWANELVGSFRYIHYTFTGFITGKLVDSIIIGIICYVGCRIMSLPYPVLLAVIVGITNIIPFFGPYIGAIVGSLLLVLMNPIAALIFLIFVIILQQFDGNILGPKILGNSTGLSSFWVIFAIMLFGSIWGFVGWLIGVPIFACIYAFIRRVTNHYLAKKGLETNTEWYRELAYIEDGEPYVIGTKGTNKYHSKKPKSSLSRIFNINKKEKNKKDQDESHK